MNTKIEYVYLPLFCPTFLQAIEREGIRIVDLCSAIDKIYPNAIRHYPDGTLMISSREAANDFDHLGARNVFRKVYHDDAVRHEGSRGATRTSLGKASIRTLSAFPDEHYVAFFIDEAARQLDNGTVGVLTARATHGRSEDSPLDSLLVSIEFARAVSRANRVLFTALIDNYLSSVSHNGVLNEGPVFASSAAIGFSSKLCQFTLDAHATGPHTINWLILRMLSFVPQVAISCISFTKTISRYNPRTRKLDEVGFEEAFGNLKWYLPVTASISSRRRGNGDEHRNPS